MKKYRIYIDEVGNSDLKTSENLDHRFLCLSGVIFDLKYVQNIFQPDLEKLKEKYFKSHPDDPVILHRKELVYKKGSFDILQNSDSEKLFNADLFGFLQNWDFKIIGSIIDKQEHKEKYSESWKYDPYHYCLEVILERYRLFLKVNNAVGDVMIESRGGKEDMRLKESFRKLMDDGTSYLKSEELRQQITSKEIKVKNKSANVAGLQLADLLAHSVRRYGWAEIWDIKEEKKTFSDKIINLLLEHQKFFTYKEKIISYGIKKLP